MDSISAYFFHAEDKSVTDPREQAFHNLVREYVIVILIISMLYGLSYLIISWCRRRGRDDCEVSPNDDDEDALVYRISLWMCTFSLAISIGSASLLPFSVVTNEILILYPDSYYTQWLNEDLVQRLWNNVFLFSNISLFILLPFAYFFTESEGFSGSRKGIMSRVNEAIVLLIILTILVAGMTYLICLILGHQELGIKQLIFVWQSLPFIYSCVSFFGVLFLLVCTPVGIAKLFSVLGELVVKPRFLRNIQEEYDLAVFEEMHLQRKIDTAVKWGRTKGTDHQDTDVRSNASKLLDDDFSSFSNMTSIRSKSMDSLDDSFTSGEFITSTPRKPKIASKVGPVMFSKPRPPPAATSTTAGAVHETSFELRSLLAELSEVQQKRKSLGHQKRASAFRRNFGYPIAMLALLSLTVTSALLVVQNTLELLVGIKALPVSSAANFSLGISSLSKLGLLGTVLEVTLILYLWSASIVGLYSLPFISRLKPRIGDTSFTCIIGNCVLLLVLSSALPVLSRIVGITNFDLLGDFGRIEWLANFNIVLVYNIFFASSTAFSLTNKFTEPVRHELLRRFSGLFAEGFFAPHRHQSISYGASDPMPPITPSTSKSLTNGGTAFLNHKKHEWRFEKRTHFKHLLTKDCDDDYKNTRFFCHKMHEHIHRSKKHNSYDATPQNLRPSVDLKNFLNERSLKRNLCLNHMLLVLFLFRTSSLIQ